MKLNKKKKFTIKNKKGQGATPLKIIIIAVVIIITGFVLIGGGVPKIIQILTGLGDTYEEVAGLDCDNDGFKGEFGEDCPCIYVAKGESDVDLLGCPKGTSDAVAAEDRRTCSMFLTETEGEYSNDCTFKDKEKCKRRCEDIQGKTVGLKSDSAAKGASVKGDLEATIVNVKYGSNEIQATFKSEGQILVNFENKKEATLVVDFTIKNVGTEDIIDVFSVAYSLCDKQKRNCKDIPGKMYRISGLNKGQTNTEKTISLLVGIDGDNCDGLKDGNCFLRFKVDSGKVDGVEELNEGVEGERNNVAFVRLAFRNQLLEKFEFDRYQITVVTDGKDECKGVVCEYWRYQSRKAPEGLGLTGGYTTMQSIQEWYEGKGYDQWQNIPSVFPQAGSCWVISEIKNSVFDDELGAIALRQEKIISHRFPDFLKPVPYETPEDEDAIKAAKETEWKADSDGDIICSDNWWHLCSEQANKKILSIGNKNYFCCGKDWKDKACN